MTNTTTISDTNTAATDILPAAKKKRRRPPHGYAVTNEELLYEISNAGMLCALHGVTGTADNRMYHFDRSPDVKSIIDKFNERSIAT